MASTNPFAFTAWTHRPLGVMVLAMEKMRPQCFCTGEPVES